MNPIKEIKRIKELADLLDDMQKIDADGDGVADLKEHLGAVQRVAPHVVSLQKNIMEAQKDLDNIKAEMGSDFDLIMKDYEVIQPRVVKLLS